jgi:hypothetical protein
VPHHRVDGRSFAHLLDATTFASPARPWRTTHLTVYRPLAWPRNCVADHGGPAVPSPALSATPSNGTPPDRSQLPWTANGAAVRTGDVRETVRYLMRQIGGDPLQYGAHSLRYGGDGGWRGPGRHQGDGTLVLGRLHDLYSHQPRDAGAADAGAASGATGSTAATPRARERAQWMGVACAVCIRTEANAKHYAHLALGAVPYSAALKLSFASGRAPHASRAKTAAPQGPLKGGAVSPPRAVASEGS